MEERDQVKVILLPRDVAEKDRSISPGSVVITADCGHECYIAPSTANAMKDPDNDYSTICGRCLDPKEVVDEMRLVPESIQELLDSYPPEVVLAMLEYAKSGDMRRKWAEDMNNR